uniref:Uncharacterized protein n=1 Tax=Rousettus aegyptiacus TaxID=9407 RepID=A0A7J8FGK2_ROUAE|nr:hypothetical protein HJG63_005756 [Rousettus aegyptiacus]
MAELGRTHHIPMSSHGAAAAGQHCPGCVPGVQQDEAADRPLQEDHEDISSFHLQRHHGWQNTPCNLCGHQDVQTLSRSHLGLWGL